MRRIAHQIMAVAIAALTQSAPVDAAAAPHAEPRLVAGGLAFPTNLGVSVDGRIFFGEKDTGDIRVIEDGRLRPTPFDHVDVVGGSETGLLGLGLHPGFPDQPWVYVYYSDAADGRNRLIRIVAEGDVGADRQNLIDGLTFEHGYHNGGDIAFGLDGALFLAIGEAHEADRAQDPNDIGGKVLRIEADGTLAPDNPFGPENPVYSTGHRNSFGLCVDPDTGELWATENGPGTDDEVNRVIAGGNYGWPDQLGPGGEPPFIDPVVTYRVVIVPTGCAVWGGALYVGSYATGHLHRIALPAEPGAAVDDVVARFDRGITDVTAGPDGDLYVATSDSIWSIRGERAPMSPIPVPSPRPSASPPGDGDAVTTRVVAVAAAIAAAAGLALRLAAGRRLRRTRPPAGGE